MKRTELKRTTPMPRGTSQLRRATGLDARGNLPRLSSPSRAGKRKTPRETGFSQAAKLLIRTRAGNGDPADARCEACGVWLGRYGGQCQHIHARGTGGHSRVSNGALLCGTSETGCHGLCERRKEHMRAQGFWRRSSDPVSGIMLHDASGGGLTVWLTDSGEYSLTPPEAVTVA